MKRLLSSVLSTSEERIKNPFFGSFIISWIVLNWQGIFYFILANNTIEEKLSVINKAYCDIWLNLLLPIGIALFYTLIFPKFFLLVEKFTKNISEERLINSIGESEKLTFAKNEKVQRELELEEKKKNFSDLKSQNELIENLRNENTELKNQISSYSKEIKELQSEKSRIISNKQEFKNFRVGKKIHKAVFKDVLERKRNEKRFIDKLNSTLDRVMVLEPEKDSNYIEFYTPNLHQLDGLDFYNLTSEFDIRLES